MDSEIKKPSKIICRILVFLSRFNVSLGNAERGVRGTPWRWSNPRIQAIHASDPFPKCSHVVSLIYPKIEGEKTTKTKKY